MARCRYSPRAVTGDPQGTAPVEVVFVCTGNRARSPLGEAILRHLSVGLPVAVSSRGTADVGQAPALPEMVAAAAALGVDLSAHRAARLRHGELRDAGLVLGFEPHHVAAAVVEGGAPPGVAFTLVELIGLLDGPSPFPPADGAFAERLARDLKSADGRRAGRSRLGAPGTPDPLGRPQAMFDALAREIDAHVRSLVRRWSGD